MGNFVHQKIITMSIKEFYKIRTYKCSVLTYSILSRTVVNLFLPTLTFKVTTKACVSTQIVNKSKSI